MARTGGDTRAEAGAPFLDILARPLRRFFELEAASGILLFAAAVAALAWVNLPGIADTYEAVFGRAIALGSNARITVRAFVNDGLMTVFFFLVGMEIKRELAVGELRTPGKALLPAVAALGGMAVPAAIFFLLNRGGPGEAGWGVPMATDIAFSLGCLKLLGRRVPPPLVVFLTALAIFDDVGGIVVIALFYGSGLHLEWLLAAALVTAFLLGMTTLRVAKGLAWAAGGAVLWYALHHSGIHATIAGVVLGLAIPVRPLNRFVAILHPYVAFGIMPLFALANSGVSLRGVGLADLAAPVALGASLGLFAGKQVGIFVFTVAAVRLRLSPMPGGASHAKLYGVSIVAGVGFTVALFIAALAYGSQPRLLDQAKLGILLGSLLAGVVGYGVLRLTRAAPAG